MSNRLKARKLRIVIVEDHHHALEHIHANLRRTCLTKGQTSIPSWHMLHFDAHPDRKFFFRCILNSIRKFLYHPSFCVGIFSGSLSLSPGEGMFSTTRL